MKAQHRLHSRERSPRSAEMFLTKAGRRESEDTASGCEPPQPVRFQELLQPREESRRGWGSGRAAHGSWGLPQKTPSEPLVPPCRTETHT